MPSDAKKKRQQAKKEVSKQKDKPKKKTEENGVTNGNEATNGHAEQNGRLNDNVTANEDVQRVTENMNELDIAAIHRAVAGVLGSHPDSRDVHIDNLAITFHGAELLSDTSLVLNCGQRYGLIGLNGCGKSSLLSAIGRRELPIPEQIDIFHLTREMPPSEKTALEAVMEVDSERMKLEKEAERLAILENGFATARLLDIYDQLEEMDAQTAKSRAAAILHGLGFSSEKQNMAVKNFSGGWRMRIALARALFVKPAMLLLDEPTNHLDLEACVWLEQELKTYKRILVIISHSQDFLNGVCTNIIHMHKRKLIYFGGNYDSYVQTRSEQEENQMKQYRWQQGQIAHMTDYIARFGHGSAKLARQAQSKEKTLKKMVDAGLTEKVVKDKTLTFYFPDCGELAPPIIQVDHVRFQYKPGQPNIYNDLNLGIDLDSRIALVGPNGAGKSTFLKLIAGELVPTEGSIRRHSHLKIGRYHQHLQEQLDLNMSALEWMMSCYPDVKEKEEMRRIIGRYGLTGQQQVCPIRNLSDGQRCRIIFAWIAWKSPHMLLLDEPTNHLDIETIDALAEAINDFEGGTLLVSHDFRLISQVAEEIWECDKGRIKPWSGDIFSYKESLVERVIKENKKQQK